MIRNFYLSFLVNSVILGLTFFLSPTLKAGENKEAPDLIFVERATDFTLRHHVGSSVRFNARNPSLKKISNLVQPPFPQTILRSLSSHRS